MISDPPRCSPKHSRFPRPSTPCNPLQSEDISLPFLGAGRRNWLAWTRTTITWTAGLWIMESPTKNQNTQRDCRCVAQQSRTPCLKMSHHRPLQLEQFAFGEACPPALLAPLSTRPYPRQPEPPGKDSWFTRHSLPGPSVYFRRCIRQDLSAPAITLVGRPQTRPIRRFPRARPLVRSCRTLSLRRRRE